MTPTELKALRSRLGMTQKELADAVGVHVMTIWKWEHGYIKPWGPAIKMLENLSTTAPAKPQKP